MSAPAVRLDRGPEAAGAAALAVRPCTSGDRRRLDALLAGAACLHQHLDWLDSLDVLGEQPFLLAEREGLPLGCLACPPHHPQAAWVRLLAVREPLDLDALWGRLWASARAQLRASGRQHIGALVQAAWLGPLLERTGFEHAYDVVFLERDCGAPRQAAASPPGLRPLRPADLPAVAALDRRAFDPLWQLSPPSLRAALRQAVRATVVERGGRVVAYLIATHAPGGAHLGRLAVDPAWQRQGLARGLVFEALRGLSVRSPARMTVNTQSTNTPSLELYGRLGFVPAGSPLPVYLAEIEAE